MSKKKIVIIQDNVHEYTVKVNEKPEGVGYKLKYSKGTQWTNPDTTILKAFDDGDGIFIGDIYYDYDEVSNLKILLDSIVANEPNLMQEPILIKK